ncbi:uroporphyrinogen decarboxylase [Synechocystis sp. PCC 6803]|uniref:Uroporphyrinogen decarboxylase n=1 Tax=Synechocystis sp. (strain ATCC 27184 / PCC 6803 / Kazusa) TaxID=1111708 RepID=DCUP_SYNY3|nr:MULTISPECIES: uroporphyrinogen decarboxylase [unclassified Synechocystis]P54224.1 RecName: Full=Uroporphyrinogen decarboxylase; Short=UPD; Short=URO-D [Synechocystis sp. PCC 6803 substr. Kazusa]BAM53578.1 uroporphyrinogen decarboxylase [Synechocystis sp. PCC 6803] [Bacillus subtilis BEST7613]AGF53115.1 uroporphyrinogen decarboxylase [Synechocystis sp. PCC 6803]ALJ68994.1 uroporphyrinogen decarboxylase [Synechocystis sp. PCC 6803]AVP90858.1 uroporphyrinogen decarboxylase [Synechocystis sp. I
MTEANDLPYLLRVARGEVVKRPPVWMMRQAGRYMKVYRDLRDKYPSFRERSENPDLAIEISLQPWQAFQPDGVIMFSDILTPLPGIGIPFDIIESKGPIIDPPIRTQAQVDQLHALDPESSLPFIKTILGTLRKEVGNQSTVLGFVGAPWTLAAYAIEGKSSKDYKVIKQMAFSEPAILHSFLDKIAEAIAVYVRYQIDCGAQVVQLFDSWAGQLSPQDYDTFALPYQQKVVKLVKEIHPDTPLILYISGSAGILERMGKSGVDIVSVDWTVDMADARQRLGKEMKVQGNMDPGVLFGSQDFIKERILDTVRKAGQGGHIFNLGHGVLVGTPEDNVRFFFETAKQVDQLL